MQKKEKEKTLIFVDWPQAALEDIPGVRLQRKNSVKDATATTDHLIMVYYVMKKDQGVNPGFPWALSQKKGGDFSTWT